ncbi:hypothetical protein [Catenulispora yoronensis]
MNITEATAELVADAIREHLETLDTQVTGISCIARGADSVFAQTVLDTGGTLEVILPSANYRQTKVKPDHAPTFDALLAKAAVIHTMPFPTANREAYEAANSTMLDNADALVAVWDGQPSPDRGGTAGAVADAHDRGLPVTVIWPAGAARQ